LFTVFDIISGVKQKYRINLNRAEEEALQDLLSDQSIVILCFATDEDGCVKGNKITCEENVKLLGITVDSHLNFDKHISEICKKKHPNN
jgi:hypothetical protein